jgi:hypothetical protein
LIVESFFQGVIVPLMDSISPLTSILFASFLIKWKPVAPCGSSELERLSNAGVEALLM